MESVGGYVLGMSVEGQKFYPGADASASELIGLADEFRRAAESLRPTGRRKAPLSYSPYRLLAIHAVELYLSAYLRAKGTTSAKDRGFQHNLKHRLVDAKTWGLKLRKLTEVHLQKLTDNREYLAARYEATGAADMSQVNRLEATLCEIADKVEAAVSRA